MHYHCPGDLVDRKKHASNPLASAKTMLRSTRTRGSLKVQTGLPASRLVLHHRLAKLLQWGILTAALTKVRPVRSCYSLTKLPTLLVCSQARKHGMDHKIVQAELRHTKANQLLPQVSSGVAHLLPLKLCLHPTCRIPIRQAPAEIGIEQALTSLWCREIAGMKKGVGWPSFSAEARQEAARLDAVQQAGTLLLQVHLRKSWSHHLFRMPTQNKRGAPRSALQWDDHWGKPLEG